LVHRRQPGAIRWKKNNRSALRLMRISAAAEAAGDKHPVTPGGVVPMRELLGEMLLRLDHPGPAFAEFERSLAREPDRFRSIYGAALAAEAANSGLVMVRLHFGSVQ
jgi:hypothetical protein